MTRPADRAEIDDLDRRIAELKTLLERYTDRRDDLLLGRDRFRVDRASVARMTDMLWSAPLPPDLREKLGGLRGQQ